MFNIILSEANFFPYTIRWHKTIKCSPIRNDALLGVGHIVPYRGNISYVAGETTYISLNEVLQLIL